jgi:hypothetical protein
VKRTVGLILGTDRPRGAYFHWRELAWARNPERKSAVNDKDDFSTTPNPQGLSTSRDQSAIPLGQQPPSPGSFAQSPSSSQPQGQAPGQGQAPQQGQGQEHAEGAIPKAVEAIEKAADKGLEKTSDVVGSTIDKVADAAISALGGNPDKNHGN